jgi:calcineurin-like phosphoesterase family protein
MAQSFFTADTHFSHRGIVEHGWRPEYTDVEEMNEDLIKRWNATVTKRDTVWHLGDWALGSPTEHLQIVKRLNGIKHLIPGNHDKCWPARRDSYTWQSKFLEAGFTSVQAFARKKIIGEMVMMSHFPYVGDHYETGDRFSEYRPVNTGAWLLHGHIHREWKVRGRMINVGVDVNEFRPVSHEEIVAIMNAEEEDE